MIKILRLSFLISLLVLSNSVFGLNRYFTWVEPNTNLRYRINLDTYELFKENEAGKWENKNKIKLDPSIFNHIPPHVNNNFFIYNNGDRVRITIQGTGQVYEFFPSKKELVRVDNTFHSGYNFGSNLFLRKGVLYSIGGEGFWNYNTTITYFNEETKEWDIYKPKNKGPLAIVDGYQGYDPKLDVYYSGGSFLGNYLEDEKREYLDDFYRFDFKRNQWLLLGKINPDLPLIKSREVIWTGEFFFHFADGKIYIINPEKNEVYQYKDNRKVFTWGYNQYVSGDTIVTFFGVNNGPAIKLSISEIQRNSKYFGEFYTSGIESSYWYYLTGIILLISLPLGYSLIKKKKKKLVDFPFTDLEKKLLLKLLELNQGEFLTTHDINDILETSNKTQENQRRIRFNVISQINKKLQIRFGIRNGVERTSLPEDKRLSIYKLNQEIVGEVRNLFG